ncbi:hypothetical protein [Mycobacteroides abscessus]|uniref:Uncharacterized protein n=1 Tax=Mycobacteroides abscessus TaxID=36809 RepID=A0A0U0ZT12_9MYCO|nr:hypothetical protein [Mycobacteroides abscessus]CPV66737.1 Uncharacterised protein [Mycobacteroides abscessus]
MATTSVSLPTEERIEITLVKDGHTIYRNTDGDSLLRALTRVGEEPEDTLTSERQIAQYATETAAQSPRLRRELAYGALGVHEGFKTLHYLEDDELQAQLACPTLPIPTEFVDALKAKLREIERPADGEDYSGDLLELTPDGHTLMLSNMQIGYYPGLKFVTTAQGHTEVHIYATTATPNMVQARTAIDLTNIDAAVTTAFLAWTTTL